MYGFGGRQPLLPVDLSVFSLLYYALFVLYIYIYSYLFVALRGTGRSVGGGYYVVLLPVHRRSSQLYVELEYTVVILSVIGVCVGKPYIFLLYDYYIKTANNRVILSLSVSYSLNLSVTLSVSVCMLAPFLSMVFCFAGNISHSPSQDTKHTPTPVCCFRQAHSCCFIERTTNLLRLQKQIYIYSFLRLNGLLFSLIFFCFGFGIDASQPS